MKAALYTRVSTHWQIDKDSLRVQRQELLQYAALMLGTTDCVVFEDAGFSAKNTDRPKYREMMARIRKGEFTHLLVWKIDRISRNLLDFTNMYSELKALGVTFVSKNEAFDTSSAIGEAMLKIILVFAELERSMTSERVTAVMLSRAQSGLWNGGRIPYGYSYDKATKEFSLNREEALVVKKIFRVYEATKSILATTKNLNESGIRTRAGTSWNTVGVHKILKNPFYVGSYRYNVHDSANQTVRPEQEWTLIENHHVPLIERDQFDRVQSILVRNRKLDTQYVNYHTDKTYLFSGLAFCGHCGSKMTPSTSKPRKNGHTSVVYGCTKRRRQTSFCTNKYVTESSIADFVFTIAHNLLSLSAEFSPSDSLFRINERLSRGLTVNISEKSLDTARKLLCDRSVPVYFAPTFTESDTDNAEIARAERRRAEDAIRRLNALYVNGDIAADEHAALLASYREQIDNLTAEPDVQPEFSEKASYYLFAQFMTEEPFSPRKISDYTLRTTQEQFIRSVIKRITIRDGQITSIEFTSGLSLEFT